MSFREWWSELDHRIMVKTVVFAILLLVVWWNGHSGLQARQRETCEGLNETKATLVEYIDAQITRSQKSLPTIEYYKRHPVELGQALARIERQRDETHEVFAPTDC